MQRVAYVCADPGVPVFGMKGCSVHVQEVVRAFRRLGFEVDLYAQRLGGKPPADLSDLDVVHAKVDREGDVRARERASMQAAEDIAHSLARRPYDLVYERYSLWSASAMEYAKANGIPGILEVNAPLIEEQALHRGLEDREAAVAIARRAFAAAVAIVAVSDGVADYLADFAETRGCVHVIPNGVDPGRFDPSGRVAPSPGALTVGFVGTLKPWHDLQTLASAFHLLHAGAPKAQLLIVGDGPARTELEHRFAAEDLLGSVHFTGAVPPVEVPRWLNAMDVGVAPYAAQAGFYFSPLKIVEYMAAGLPTVASHIVGLEPWIQNEETGILVRPEDPLSLLAALERLRLNRTLRERLGARARAQVEERHTWDAAVTSALEHAGLATSPQLAD